MKVVFPITKKKMWRATLKKVCEVIGAVVIAVVIPWCLVQSLSREAEEMEALMVALQREADSALHSPAVLVLNAMAGWRWLGPFRPDAIPPHACSCTPPSTSLRFLPLAGQALLRRRFMQYADCMNTYLFRAQMLSDRLARVVMAVTGAALLLLAWCVLYSYFRRRIEERISWHFSLLFDFKRREEDDEEFLRRRVPFLTEWDLLALGSGEALDSGFFGTVTKVNYQGNEAVVKTLKDEEAIEWLLREARMMVEVNGAGGVPALLAVCLRPPALVQAFAGDTYDEFLEQCHVGAFLDSLVAIAGLLGEIHAKGIAHNDVRPDNITFTGSVREPVFHLIDLGLTCRFGEVACELTESESRLGRDWSVPSRRHRREDCSLCDDNDKDDAIEEYEWLLRNFLAPEVMSLQPSYAYTDVYSLGAIVMFVLQIPESTHVLEPLWTLVETSTPYNPARRCLLTCFTRTVVRFKARLSPDQLFLPLLGSSRGGLIG